MAKNKKPKGPAPPRPDMSAEQKAAADVKMKAKLDDFHKRWSDSMLKERQELATAPKVHDASKGEFVEEVDPALADK